MHFYFPEEITLFTVVKTLKKSNHVKAIGRQATDVCFAFTGLTPETSLTLSLPCGTKYNLIHAQYLVNCYQN